LNVSERTVRRRVLRVYGKLYVRERVDAALYAEHHGLRAIDGDGGVGHPSPA
jgi:DNA-binding NarL/FixJ family response regulator